MLIHLFGYSIFSFKKLTFDELKVIVKECQLSMLLALRNIHSETQKHVIGVFPCVEGDETSHIVDGTYTKCTAIPFISDALDWCFGNGCKFSHAHKGFLLLPNKRTKRKIQQKGLCKGSMNATYLLGSSVEVLSIFKQNIVQSRQRKRETKSHKVKAINEDD